MPKHQLEEVIEKPRTLSLALSRSQLYLFLLGCLLLPAIIVTCFGAEVRGIFFVALLSALFAGGGAWYVLRLWEVKMQCAVSKLVKTRLAQAVFAPSKEEIVHLQQQLEEARRGYEHQIDLLQSSVAKSKDAVHQLNLEMDKKNGQMRLAYLEFEDLRKAYYRLEEDHMQERVEYEQQLSHKEALNNEYQRTISEQRTILEKKQSYIAKLEDKVHDLMHEIRGLLQLEQVPIEMPLPAAEDYLPVPTSTSTLYDLSIQLQRFIEKAESQTGMEHLGGKSPRFLDLSDSYAVDRRRLFDCFRDETAGIVFILSMTEKKFLFVNQYVKTFLGWSPEKFMKEFPQLVISGYAEWKKGLNVIGQVNEYQTHMTVQTRIGEHKKLVCLMGVITKGPFTNHIIGMLAQ